MHAVERDWLHIMITYHYFPRDDFVQMCKLLSCFRSYYLGSSRPDYRMLEAMKNALLGHFMSHFNDVLSLLVQQIMQNVFLMLRSLNQT